MPLTQIFAALSICLCLGAGLTRPAAAQNFAAPIPISGYGLGAYSTPIILYDLNGDGNLDYIVGYMGEIQFYNANGGVPGGISISNGDGKGGFTQAGYGSLGYGTAGPVSFGLGDFNADGVPDILAPMSDGQSISAGSSNGTPYTGTVMNVLFGKPTGCVSASGPYSVGAEPLAAAGADFNGDGIPDVAVTNASGIITVYLGVGAGLYESGLVYHVGGTPAAIRIGDFNHDGKLDLATVNLSDGSLSLLIGRGDGTFQKPQRVVIGPGLKDAQLADLNGDGQTDIVALRSISYTNSGEIDVLLHQLDGTFVLSAAYPVTSTANALLLADFSGKGVLDALTGDGVITRNIGSAAGNTALVTNSGNLAVGDVNGDGKLDFVVGNQLFLNIGAAKSSAFTLFIDVEPEGLPSPNTSSRLNGYMILNGPNVYPATTSFYGEFTQTYSNLPAKGCSFHITAASHLTVDVALDGTSGAYQYLKVILPAGDANNDNRVDTSDFNILVGAFGNAHNANIPDSVTGYDARADFNYDGVVDAADFNLLAGNYGRVGDP